MKWLFDIFRFIGTILCGMPDRAKAYSDDLEMAERYVRWGRERGDLRDFQSSLVHGAKCVDAEAATPAMIKRRYAAAFDALLGIMDLNIVKYQKKQTEAAAEMKDITDDLDEQRRAYEAGKKRVDQLNAAGSMIKAKEEQRGVDEMGRQVEKLSEMAKQRLPYAVLAAEYSKTLNEFHRAIAMAEENISLFNSADVSPADRMDLIRSACGNLVKSVDRMVALAPDSIARPTGIGETLRQYAGS